MAYGVLRFSVPGRPLVEHVLDIPAVVVGRSPENYVVVDSVSVSRRHARLTVDSGHLLVEDLDSDGGTFVAGTRLAPNTPCRLNPGQAFLIGDVEVVFVPDEAITPREPEREVDEIAPQGVAISVASPSSPIEPGTQVALSVGLTNRSGVVDEFAVRVVGLPAEWVRIPRAAVTLMPSARDEVTIVVVPPRSSAAPAGRHEFAIAAVSEASGAEVRVLTELTLLPFAALRAEIQPVRGTGDFRLTVANEGNAETLLMISGTDDEEALAFRFPARSLALPAGESQTLPVAITMKEPWTGEGVDTRAFSIEVVAGPVAEVVSGQLILTRTVAPTPVDGPRPAADRAATPPGKRKLLTQLYIAGIVILLLLAFLEGQWELWTTALGAWAVGLPLGVVGWRSTSKLEGPSGFLTRAGCLGAVLLAGLVAGIGLLVLVYQIT